ncbi:MAG: lipase family protein, partial [Betaproteobacteria bacterium]|nr:lipase family protein [Betaproteobacteria bacterium]
MTTFSGATRLLQLSFAFLPEMDIQPSHPGGQVPRRPSPDYSRVVERAQEIRQSAGKPMSEALDQAFEEARQPPQASAPANVDELLADPARWPHHMDAWCSVHAWLAYRPLREVEAVLTGAGIDGIDLSLLLPLSSTTAHADALGFAPMSPQLVASVARCARVLELKQQIQAEGYGDFLAVEEEARELRAFCVRRKDVLVIAFRGTVTCSNWRDDFRCWPVHEAPRRHRGFLGCWRALAPRITDWVRAQAPRTPRLVVTGHSLGGALATLAASDLMCAGIAGLRIEAVSLFGCPRVGLAGFADAYGK